MKKFLAVILSVCLILGVCASAFAADSFKKDIKDAKKPADIKIGKKLSGKDFSKLVNGLKKDWATEHPITLLSLISDAAEALDEDAEDKDIKIDHPIIFLKMLSTAAENADEDRADEIAHPIALLNLFGHILDKHVKEDQFDEIPHPYAFLSFILASIAENEDNEPLVIDHPMAMVKLLETANEKEAEEEVLKHPYLMLALLASLYGEESWGFENWGLDDLGLEDSVEDYSSLLALLGE